MAKKAEIVQKTQKNRRKISNGIKCAAIQVDGLNESR